MSFHVLGICIYPEVDKCYGWFIIQTLISEKKKQIKLLKKHICEESDQKLKVVAPYTYGQIRAESGLLKSAHICFDAQLNRK